MLLTDYRLDAVHTFQVRTLSSLGYRTRVVLSNASGKEPQFRTTYRIDITVFGPSHCREQFLTEVATLAPDDRLLLDCTPFTSQYAEDVIVIFHLVPLRLVPQARNGFVDVMREEVFFLSAAQDHYVEYYRADGFSAGILYQAALFNYEKLGPPGMTIIQAPKVYVSDEVDTFLSLMNCSPLVEYDRRATLRLALENQGVIVDSWLQTLQPFEASLIGMRQRLVGRGLKLASQPRLHCLYGVCEDATVVPITINYNRRTGAIGLEHTLPPMYYAEGMVGPRRAQVIRTFAQSALQAPRH